MKIRVLIKNNNVYSEDGFGFKITEYIMINRKNKSTLNPFIKE